MMARDAYSVKVERSALRRLELSLVSIIEIRLANLAVLATTKTVSVPRKPSVEEIHERSYQRNLEQPREQPPLGKDFQQLFQRGGGLPRLSIARANYLHGLDVSPRRNPGKPLADPGSLRWNDLELVISIPSCQHPHHAPAHFAVSIIDHRITPVRLTNAWRKGMIVRVVAAYGEPNDWNRRHADASIDGDSTPTASTMISGGCVSVS